MPGRFPMNGYDALSRDVAALGLTLRGGFELSDADSIPAASSLGDSGGPARTLVLIGAVGDSHWPAFSASLEYRDGLADPLDRWSRRLLTSLAAEWSARALFPFGDEGSGPGRHWPFQRWAARAEPVHPSPLGLLIHPLYGLWHSYRGALAFARPLAGLPRPEPLPSPCATCVGRPCLGGCPVGAFAAPPFDGAAPTRYDTARCGRHLAGPGGDACRQAACLARAACPVGAAHRYGPDAARFHLGAFEAALGGGTDREPATRR